MIADQALYAQRLAAFAEFYASFYNGARTYDGSTGSTARKKFEVANTYRLLLHAFDEIFLKFLVRRRTDNALISLL